MKILKFLTLFTLLFSLSSGAVFSQTQGERIKEVFNALRANNLEILDDFYDPKVLFLDPLGKHEGLESVKNYYKNLYQNVKEIKFESKDLISNGDTHVYVWTMKLRADGLNGGKLVALEGNSVIKFNDKDLVYYHRDYFDMGAFIYEYVPVLGWVIKKIKTRLKR